jgi:hypothetical protein
MAGGVSASNIAQWNGTNWSPIGSGIGVNNEVLALAASGSTLYAGGYFTTAGSSAANYVAQWNGTNWSPLGSGVSGMVNYITGVNSVVVSSSGVYVGGRFTTAGSVTANGIARWNGTNWSALGSGMNGYVNALAVSDNLLFAAGEFSMAGGTPVSNIAQWNGTSWSSLGSGINGEVNALLISGNTLYVGGGFTTAGTNISADVAAAILPLSVSILTTDGNFGFANGLFGFDISGPAGSNVVIQSSADLQNWTSLQTNTLNSNGLLYFSDSQSPSNRKRFYQAVLP